MEMHFKPYAGMISQELVNLALLETFLNTASDPITGNVRSSLEFSAQMLKDRALELGLKASTSKAIKLHHACVNDHDAKTLWSWAKDLRDTMPNELFQVQFLPASYETVAFFNKKSPFGEAVEKTFPDCSEDIDEAHKCFALERYTASMFHLGRVMEIATKKLWKKMKGAKPVNQNWQGYLIEIDNVIASMPHKLQSERDKRAPFKEASGFSMSFKEAWRNPGTHDPKKTYTRNEALEVIAATKAFMNAAAIKIFKVKMV